MTSKTGPRRDRPRMGERSAVHSPISRSNWRRSNPGHSTGGDVTSGAPNRRDDAPDRQFWVECGEDSPASKERADSRGGVRRAVLRRFLLQRLVAAPFRAAAETRLLLGPFGWNLTVGETILLKVVVLLQLLQGLLGSAHDIRGSVPSRQLGYRSEQGYYI